MLAGMERQLLNSFPSLIFMNHIHAFVEITMSLIQQWALILYFNGPLVRPHQIPFLPTYQQQTSSTNSLAQQAQSNSMMSWAVGYSISPRLPPIHSDMTNVQMRVNGQPGWREGPIIGTRQMLPFIMECFQVLLRILIAGDFFQPWTVRYTNPYFNTTELELRNPFYRRENRNNNRLRTVDF